MHDTRLGLSCLLANGSLENPIRALSSDHFEQLLTAGRRAYDFVILDSPPVLHVADPVLLAKLCQYVIFTVAAGRVPGEQVGEATRRFPAGRSCQNVRTVDPRTTPAIWTNVITIVAMPGSLDRNTITATEKRSSPNTSDTAVARLMSAIVVIVTASVTICTKGPCADRKTTAARLCPHHRDQAMRISSST